MSPVVDPPVTVAVPSDKKKAKRKQFTRPSCSKDCPAEDGGSTIDMFPARGFANCLTLQVDAIVELEDNYDDLTGAIEVFPYPLTDGGKSGVCLFELRSWKLCCPAGLCSTERWDVSHRPGQRPNYILRQGDLFVAMANARRCRGEEW